MNAFLLKIAYDQLASMISLLGNTALSDEIGALSSALAAALAKGESLTDAARSAKLYIEKAIISGAEYSIGKGHGPVDHFFCLK